MSAQRRHQRRDHLGRFTSPTAGGARPEAAAGGQRAGVAGGKALPTAGGGEGRGPRGRLRAVRRGLGRVPGVVLAALRGELARRLYRLAVVAVGLGVAVVLLYQHGDSPAALAGAVRAASTASTASTARPAAPPRVSATTAPAAGPDRHPAPAAQPARPARPSDVAAAWYAGREHLNARQVRPLQQDKVSNREVRVLVLADRGNGRLDTALVTVRRDAKGRWSVP